MRLSGFSRRDPGVRETTTKASADTRVGQGAVMIRSDLGPAPYDEFSDAYTAYAASNPHQALYDRPAILALAGAVAGKQVLDVGCAAGHLSSNLADAGAHVIGDWGPPLGEFRRVLRRGGLLIMSVHHPEDWHWLNRPNYFRTEQVTDEFELVGQLHRVQFYRRPLSATFKALRQAGFFIDEIAEPMPLPECKDVAPDAHEKLSTRPRFLYFRASNP